MKKEVLKDHKWTGEINRLVNEAISDHLDLTKRNAEKTKQALIAKHGDKVRPGYREPDITTLVKEDFTRVKEEISDVINEAEALGQADDLRIIRNRITRIFSNEQQVVPDMDIDDQAAQKEYERWSSNAQ